MKIFAWLIGLCCLGYAGSFSMPNTIKNRKWLNEQSDNLN